MGTLFEFRNQTWQAELRNVLHFIENCMILASAVLSQYTRVTRQTNDNRRHLMAIAEPAMQLQRSVKNV